MNLKWLQPILCGYTRLTDGSTCELQMFNGWISDLSHIVCFKIASQYVYWHDTYFSLIHIPVCIVLNSVFKIFVWIFRYLVYSPWILDHVWTIHISFQCKICKVNNGASELKLWETAWVIHLCLVIMQGSTIITNSTFLMASCTWITLVGWPEHQKKGNCPDWRETQKLTNITNVGKGDMTKGSK